MTEFSSPYFAAIDLGSNSFQMIICRINQDTMETVDQVKEMVQIARGMHNNTIADDAQQRAIDCLKRFAERVRDIPRSQVRVAGTKSLRAAQNARAFLREAEKTLGHPIAIISGFEEARLVYQGLVRSVIGDDAQRLVIDIGGGSTEFAIGVDDRPQLLKSLNLGCVVFSERFNLRQKITEKKMYGAYLAASTELEQIRPMYIKKGWQTVYGTSGTMRSVAELLAPIDGGAIIRAESLRLLSKSLVNDEEATLHATARLRRDVLPAGIAILRAVFDAFELDKIQVADATLKDGLLFDTIGRLTNVDARHTAVAKLQKQYRVDTTQAARVAECATEFWRQIDGPSLPGISRTKILQWAAQLHEVGLGISHSAHHNHSYYILRYSDLAGFSRYEQRILANLVRAHRKKLSEDRFAGLESEAKEALLPMLVCLRLAVILNRRREDLDVTPQLSQSEQGFQLLFTPGWLDKNPLTAAGIVRETEHFAKAGVLLTIGENGTNS